MHSAKSKSDVFPSRGAARFFWMAAAIISFFLPLTVGGQVVNPSKHAPLQKPIDLIDFEGDATWYEVPPNSRTKQRAGKGELTAAHNRLPFGTRVRVTHLGNKKSVVVRITDRLDTKKRRSAIDLSKEAATQLDMLRQGSARVRLEILADDKAPGPNTKAPPW
jgi:rare lipoprotein A